MTRPSVVVVGGGVVGLTTAYSLRRRGADVVLLEAGTVATGASHGNAGWLVPSLAAPMAAPGVTAYALRSLVRSDTPVYLRPRADPDLVRWMWRFWRSSSSERHLAGLRAVSRLAVPTMTLYDEMASDGVDFRMKRDGLLFAFLEERTAENQLAAMQVLGEFGYSIPTELLSAAQVTAREPALSESVAAGLFIGEERHVDPTSLMTGLVNRLRQMGVEIREGVTTEGCRIVGDRVAAVETTDGPVVASTVVLAAGAWSGRLARQFGARIPIQAGKGYSFASNPCTAPRQPLYLAEAHVGVTPFGDRTRIAGTIELGGLDAAVVPRRLAAMAAAAQAYLREPIGEPEQAWAGLRPISADGLPVVGRVPGLDNVIVSTGHGTLGVTLAPVTAEGVAQLVITGRAPSELAPFSLERFSRSRASA